MFFYLAEYQSLFGPLRLFEYITFRAGGAVFTSMLLCFFLGPITIKLLKKFNTEAPTRLEGLVPEAFIDKNKDKTPSMGGLLIITSITISMLLWTNLTNPIVIIFIGTLLSLTGLGFWDDYRKLVYKNSEGVSGKIKLLLQLIIAIIAIFALYHTQETHEYMRQIMIPFFKTPLGIPSYLIMFCTFALGSLTVVGASNAVNLTDGKDGLAIGCVIFCAGTYAIFAYLSSHIEFAKHLDIPHIISAGEVVVFAAAVVGSGIGFLWFNCYPASMFMGDTGSLALGGTIGLIAVLVRQELVLLVVGGVFVMEAASVIIQVTYFKLTGKRVFLCTPIHHHFEQKGWTETQIIVRFWIFAGIFSMLGLVTLKLR